MCIRDRFWTKKGIDIRASLRAVKGVLTRNSSAGGGSTITQKLIKTAVFQGGMETSFKDRLERTIQEQYLAVRLNQMVDKKTIMTNYLNTINLGSNTLGVKVAARRYFDKDGSDPVSYTHLDVYKRQNWKDRGVNFSMH